MLSRLRVLGVGVLLGVELLLDEPPLFPPELGSSPPPQALTTITLTNKPNNRLKIDKLFFMSLYKIVINSQ